MTAKELLEKITALLSEDDFFRDFKFRKSDRSFISKNDGFRKDVQLQCAYHGNVIHLHPIYTVKFDILLNWFKKYNFKTLQDQRDNYSFGFSSSMLGKKSSYYEFSLDGKDFDSKFEFFKKELFECSNWVFTNYATLDLAYQHEIIPLLNGDKEMPDVGIEWAFEDLTLCRIVSPQNYDAFKKKVLERIEFLHSRNEPNLAHYYDKLDEIIAYMEGLSIEELENYKLSKEKSNSEVRKTGKKPGIREINKAIDELNKKDTLIRKNVSKKFGWKQSSYINWKVKAGYYFYLEHLNCYSEATLYVKPLYIDDLWWDVFEMSSNKKEPMSLRGNGTFSLDGVKILKTPDLFDIRAEESEYELEKIQKYSDEAIEKIWDDVFQQFDDEVRRFLKENPDPDSYFPGEEHCHGYYALITYLYAGDKQKVLDKIAEFRATPGRIRSPMKRSFDDGKTRDGLDFIEAWCLRELAEQGDVTAQYKLGTAYEDGSCVPIDNEKAVFWYRKAAEQGNSSAQYSLGRMFDYGCGVPEDKQEAAIWYRKAAEQGDGDAQNDLGVMYLTGEGVPEDKTQAAFWFRKAAEQGIATAQNNLGVRYLNGDGIPEDKAQAAFWFRKAAEQGLAAAQFNLGVRCFKGDGVPEDKSEAVFWFQKAAEQGLEEAQINLDLIRVVKKNIIGEFMENEFFKAIGLYIDSQYIKVYTKYWVYERGRCSTVPAFVLRRDCSDEELLKHIKICFENSKYISEKEYDNLGGWDILWNILKKALKKKSLKNFYQTSVGFCLVWEQEQTEFLKKEGETEVHISVWKYYVGKAASQRPADEKFDLKYDETSLGEFVVKLRQIMEEMYEKYHM